LISKGNYIDKVIIYSGKEYITGISLETSNGKNIQCNGKNLNMKFDLVSSLTTSKINFPISILAFAIGSSRYLETIQLYYKEEN